MERILAFKLTDGTIIADENEAKEKQKSLDYKESVIKFCEEHGYHDTKDFLYDILMDNVSDLKRILAILD